VLAAVVCYNTKACFTDSGRQPLLQEVQAILQGMFPSHMVFSIECNWTQVTPSE
jgi:hypothetical protein